MAITPIDAFPARNSASFKTRVETFFETEFPTAITEMNTAIEAFNTNDLRGTSTTAYTPNVTGNKAFTTQSGKSWVPGMWVTGGYTSGGNEYWAGPVVSYSGTTLTVNVLINSGTATSRSSWQISFSPPVADLVGDHVVSVNTGNGHGSTNTLVRRFTTTSESTGTSITYADSATLGASFTINATGIYSVYYQDVGQFTHIIARNHTTTTVTDQTKIIAASSTTGAGTKSVSATIKLTAGDVVRAMSSGSTDTTGAVQFSIRRIS